MGIYINSNGITDIRTPYIITHATTPLIVHAIEMVFEIYDVWKPRSVKGVTAKGFCIDFDPPAGLNLGYLRKSFPFL